MATARPGGGLLELLKQSEQTAAAERKWDEHSRSKGLSVTDFDLLQRKNKDNGQGWKTVDGQKKYTTFRSGKRVQLQGQDAFIAALADSKPKKKRAKTAPAAAGEETK